MSSIVIAAATAALDQWSKYRFFKTIGQDGCLSILDDKVRLEHLENEGAFMGRFKDDKKKLMAFNGAAVLLILVLMAITRNRVIRLGLALMLGGAAGNNIDRIRKGSVTDFITFGPAFRIHYNIADFAVFAGALLAVIGQITEQKG